MVYPLGELRIYLTGERNILLVFILSWNHQDQIVKVTNKI